MPIPLNSRWISVAAVGGLSYPFLVYFGLTVIPPAALLLFGLAMIVLRVMGLRHVVGSRLWISVFLLTGAGLIGLLSISPELAVKIYPVAISLAVAAVFAASLRFPPTVIERLARLTEPALSPQGVAYTRRVTQVWVAFLLSNAGISTASALWGTLDQWMLWNGLLSYIAMGILFCCEIVIRRRVRRRHEIIS